MKIEAFPDHKDELEKFVRQEKIDFKNEEDIKHLFVHLISIKAN